MPMAARRCVHNTLCSSCEGTRAGAARRHATHGLVRGATRHTLVRMTCRRLVATRAALRHHHPRTTDTNTALRHT
jgi:hypothetical protein